jgi:hypothetical protein
MWLGFSLKISRINCEMRQKMQEISMAQEGHKKLCN